MPYTGENIDCAETRGHSREVRRPENADLLPVVSVPTPGSMRTKPLMVPFPVLAPELEEPIAVFLDTREERAYEDQS